VRTLIATLLILSNPGFVVVGLMLHATTRAGK
jgi:hypothetical protein